MKREVFEQAAIEANAGLDEIDAEIQQLEARKQSLLVNRELLQTVGRQMLSVLSVISGAVPAKSGAALALSEANAVGPVPAPVVLPVSQYVPNSVRDEQKPPVVPVADHDLRRIVHIGT